MTKTCLIRERSSESSDERCGDAPLSDAPAGEIEQKMEQPMMKAMRRRNGIPPRTKTADTLLHILRLSPVRVLVNIVKKRLFLREFFDRSLTTIMDLKIA